MKISVTKILDLDLPPELLFSFANIFFPTKMYTHNMAAILTVYFKFLPHPNKISTTKILRDVYT